MMRMTRGQFVAGLALWAALSLGAPPAGAQAVKLRPGPAAMVDTKGGPLNGPGGVACGANFLVAADTGNGRFVLYDAGDRVYLPRLEFAVAEIPVPIRIHLDPQGNILALDGKSRRIGRIRADGTFLGFVAIDAAGGAAPVVRSFAAGADGTLYVLDLAGGRVLVVTPDGKPARQVALPAECGSPSDVAADASGRVYVIDAAGPRLYAASKDQASAVAITGNLRADLDSAASLAVDAAGRVFVVDPHGGGIVIFGSDGSFRGRQAGFGWTDGLLRWPSSICVTANGVVAVADRENNRVATFSIAQ